MKCTGSSWTKNYFYGLYGRQKTQEQFKKFSKAESKDSKDYKLRTRNLTKHFTVKRLICLSGEICSAQNNWVSQFCAVPLH